MRSEGEGGELVVKSPQVTTTWSIAASPWKPTEVGCALTSTPGTGLYSYSNAKKGDFKVTVACVQSAALDKCCTPDLLQTVPPPAFFTRSVPMSGPNSTISRITTRWRLPLLAPSKVQR